MQTINNIITTAQQLRNMLSHVKMQVESVRENSIAQAKLHAEAEKKEVNAILFCHDYNLAFSAKCTKINRHLFTVLYN